MLEMRHLARRKKKIKKETQTVRSAVKLAWLDVLIYFASVMGPLATLPQVLQLYITHDARGLSLLSWCMYGLLNLVWIFYGYKHREKPIVITNIAMLCLNVLVAAGIFYFS